MKADHNAAPFNQQAGQNKIRGLNNLDANLELAPFDSISNPGRSARDSGLNNPITRIAANNKKPLNLIGGNARPEIDSFYLDRNDVKYKQAQQNQ